MNKFMGIDFGRITAQQVMMSLALLAAGAVFAMNFDAIAATGSLESEFSDMWTEIKALAAGAPGKILIMLMVLGVVFFATVKPNLIGFGGCVVSILVLANAGNIIDNSFTSSIFDAPVQAVQAVLPLVAG